MSVTHHGQRSFQAETTPGATRAVDVSRREASTTRAFGSATTESVGEQLCEAHGVADTSRGSGSHDAVAAAGEDQQAVTKILTGEMLTSTELDVTPNEIAPAAG